MKKTMIVSLFHYIIQRQKSNLDKIVKDYQENYVKETKD